MSTPTPVLRRGSIGPVARACVALWMDALSHRDGAPPPAGTEARVLGKLQAPVVRFAVAESLGFVAGFALTVASADDDAAILDLLAVSPTATRQGVGRLLLADAIEHASGFDRLSLTVRTGNAAAIALYEGAGFRPTGTPSAHPLGGQPMQRYLRRMHR